MSRGGHRPNSGRPKGLRNKRQRAEKSIILPNKPFVWEGETPLEFLSKVAAGKVFEMDEDGRETRLEVDIETRVDAAKAAAPYIHRKQPVAVEQTITLPASVIIVTPLTEMNGG